MELEDWNFEPMTWPKSRIFALAKDFPNFIDAAKTRGPRSLEYYRYIIYPLKKQLQTLNQKINDLNLETQTSIVRANRVLEESQKNSY